MGVLFGLAAVGLIGLPYVGAFLGHALIDDGAIEHGYGWLPVLLMVATAISAAAVLRAGARVFLGWGPREDPLLSPEPSEEPPPGQPSMPLMAAATALLVAAGLVISVVPGLQDQTEQGAARFMDRDAYVAHVL